MKLLIVEDEAPTAAFLRRGLSEEGFAVDVAADARAAEQFVQVYDYDVIVLDVMLPGGDGFSLCRRWRAAGITTPIIFLTARDEVTDRVHGLELGGDDYLVKPFAFAEVLARLRALLRRGRGVDALRLVSGDVEMDVIARRVTRAGRPVDLTAREFELLECLLRHERQVVSRDTLARDVWHEPARSATLDNVIDVHIARLRRKIDAEFPVKMIHTVRGVGFVMREDEP